MKYGKKLKMTAGAVFAAAIMLTAGTAAAGGSPEKKDERVPETALASSGILPETMRELTVSIDVLEGGVEIRSTSAREIEAVYDRTCYNVSIAGQNGVWSVHVSGKVPMMSGKNVQLYIPSGVQRVLDVSVRSGSFRYDPPENTTDILRVTAANSGIVFNSKNHYENSDLTLTAADRDFLVYEPPVYPDYFTGMENGFAYRHGTGANRIDITLTGYTSVNCND